MFGNLRLNSQVYILHKPSNLKIGKVVSTPFKYMQYVPTTDLKVEIDGQTSEFKLLPSNMEIAYYDNGNTIISDNRELISSEIQSMLKDSQELIDSVPYHKEVIEKGEILLKQLNPEIAKQKELEVKITNLETKVIGIESKLDNIANLLTKVINDSNSKTTK